MSNVVNSGAAQQYREAAAYAASRPAVARCMCCGEPLRPRAWPVIDRATRTIAYGGAIFAIESGARGSNQMATLLEALVARAPNTVTQDTLITCIWGYDHRLLDERRSLYVEISKLRRALRSAAPDLEIASVLDLGYALRRRVGR